ncbi:MAG: ferrochelatase [Coriobacteriia bacterium]|nr:ferrochelatase [Coriobacteriia bacterium]
MASRGSHAGVLLVNRGLPATNALRDERAFVQALLGCRDVVPAGMFGRVKGGRGLRREAEQALFPVLDGFWTPDGWPYDLDHMRLVQSLNGLLSERDAMVRCGMCFGSPSVAEGVEKLAKLGCDSLLVVPLDSHIGANQLLLVKRQVRDAVERARFDRPVTYVEGFADSPVFLRALAASILHAGFSAEGTDRLMLLFESQEQGAIRTGQEPLRRMCQRTARAVAGLLGVAGERVDVAFYRPFGQSLDWLDPFAGDVLGGLREGDDAFAGRMFLAWPGVSLDGALQYYDLGQPLFGGPGVVCVPPLGRSRANLKVLESVIAEHL